MSIPLRGMRISIVGHYAYRFLAFDVDFRSLKNGK